MTVRSDLASVGYVLIELLSGRSITDARRDPDETTRTIGKLREKELLDLKYALPHRLTEILPRKILGSKYLFELCRRLVDPDPEKRFLDANDSIVDPDGGTYAFHRDLILANLAVCNFHEASQWLMDVKRATALMAERAALTC
jgi:serine/threonine-protein kinase